MTEKCSFRAGPRGGGGRYRHLTGPTGVGLRSARSPAMFVVRALNLFFKGQGAPWEVKGHKGAPWCQKGAAPPKNA
jgi:hypothetical protein